MSRKKKDLKIEEKTKPAKKSSKSATTKKKAPSKVTKAITKTESTKPKKASAAKETITKEAATKTTTKKTTRKSSTKKVASKKTATSKVKKTTTGKTKKATTKKTGVTKSRTRKTIVKKPEIIEYYDLPYRYNQTVVKILAQTPNTLFVYWDISDEDRKKYINKFGENFFNDTYPVLIIHNKTLNYSFEIEVNDFANSWYFNVNDAKCEYEIELGRRVKPIQTKINLPDNYEYVTSSNVIEAPNNHILFEKNQKILFFRNVKTNSYFQKDISSFNFMKYIGQIYNIYNIYKKIYKDEDFKDIKNPGSSFKF